MVQQKKATKETLDFTHQSTRKLFLQELFWSQIKLIETKITLQ